MSNLEDRFTSFLRGNPEAEDLDNSFHEETFKDSMKADFMLYERAIALEIKTLCDDPAYKIEEAVAKLKDRPEYPVFYGKAPLDKVLSHFPEQERLHKDINNAITKSVQGAFETANKQIKGTINSLCLGACCGVLVILNDNIEVLSPSVLANCVNRMYGKKKNGRFRYKHIMHVLIISETHITKIHDRLDGIPMVLYSGPYAKRYKESFPLMDHLMKTWSEYSGIPLINLPASGIGSVLTATLPKKAPHKTTQQDLRKQAYQEEPYLSSLPDEEVYKHGAKIIDKLAPTFLKDKPSAPEAVTKQLLIEWGDFLIEAQNRCLDMKLLSKYAPNNKKTE